MQSPKPGSPILYNRDKVLGKGGMATVYWGTYKGTPVAVKRILTANFDYQTVIREEKAMKEIDNKNVLNLIYVEDDSDFKYLVLELCAATIHDYINGEYKGPMPTEVDAMIQMASGLQCIHSKGFVHRDIKPANVLISQNAVLKISDFGFSKPTTGSGSFSSTSGPQGTKIYYAPEYLMLEGKSKEERNTIRSHKSIDLFSLGCLFFRFITKGGHPFASPGPASNQFTTMANIIEGTKKLVENGLPKGHDAYEMIDGMTQANPSDRWDLDKVLQTLEECNTKQALKN